MLYMVLASIQSNTRSEADIERSAINKAPSWVRLPMTVTVKIKYSK